MSQKDFNSNQAAYGIIICSLIAIGWQAKNLYSEITNLYYRDKARNYFSF